MKLEHYIGFALSLLITACAFIGTNPRGVWAFIPDQRLTQFEAMR